MEDKEHIRFVGMKPTRSLLRFVERQVKKWISREQGLLFLPKSADYKVRVEREENYPYYQCDVEVCIGSRRWHSFECGRTLHDALTHALRRMKSVATFTQRPLDIATTTTASSHVA